MRSAAVVALAVLAAGCPPVEPGAKPTAHTTGLEVLAVVLGVLGLVGVVILVVAYVDVTAQAWAEWAERKTRDLLAPRRPEPDKPCPYCGARREGDHA